MDRLTGLLFSVYAFAVIINKPSTMKAADKKICYNSFASLENQCSQLALSGFLTLTITLAN